jgi:hypothetical protein
LRYAIRHLRYAIRHLQLCSPLTTSSPPPALTAA